MTETEVVGRMQCPSCAASGGDNRGDNLVVYGDGHSHCYACGYTKGTSNYKPKPREVLDMSDQLSCVLSSRNITTEVSKKYELSLNVDVNTHQVSLCIPVVGSSGKKTGDYVYREVVDGKITHNQFTDKGTKLTAPLGWQLYKQGNAVLITEGVTDCLRAASVGKKELTVLGMWNAALAERTANFAVRYISEDSPVYICFDNDVAGNKARDKFMSVFHVNNRKLKVINLERKDLADELDSGTYLQPLLDNAEVPLGVGLETGSTLLSNYWQDMEKRQTIDSIEFSFSPSLASLVYFSPETLVGIVGQGGAGKTTFVNSLIWDMLANRKHVLFFSTEMGRLNSINKLAEVSLGKKVTHDSVQRFDEEDNRKLETTLRLISNYAVFDFGLITLANIEEKIQQVKSTCELSYVIIDHALAIAQDSDTGTLLLLYKKLKEIAMKHGVCVVIITHSNRSGKYDSDKENNVELPTASCIYNSSALMFMADAIIGLGSNKDRKITVAQSIKLDRISGEFLKLVYKYENCRLIEIETKEEDNAEEEEQAADLF